MTQFLQLDLRDEQPAGDEVLTTEQLLSTRQQIAMLSLLAGETQRQAAQRAGVRAETVNRWANSDEQFMQLYAMRKKDVWRAFEIQIASLVPLALGAIIDLMRSEDHHAEAAYNPRVRLDAAELALTLAGLLRKGPRVFAPNAQLNIGDKQVNVNEGQCP